MVSRRAQRARPEPQRIIEAPLEMLQRLAELRRARDAQIAERMSRADVLGILGITPNCAVQYDAVATQLSERGVGEGELAPLVMKHLVRPDMSAAAGVVIPDRCGRCPQERFLDLPHEDLDVLYGGAGGGGKSFSLLALALRACVRFPGIQVFWFRRSFPELNQSVLRMLARFGYASALGATWNGSTYELRFPGGSVLTFAHAKNMAEASALSSAEINLLILDERTTLDPEVVEFLYTRVRSGVVGVPCLGIRSASNPGFVGHGVVKEGWVDATDYGRNEIIDEAHRRRIFIPAKISDNPFVGDYAQVLEGITDPDLRRRILDGDWSVMPDAAFGDWKRDLIVVPPFEVPPAWPRYGGLDYGWTAPSAYLLGARDADGRVWIYRELTMVQTPEKDQAHRIAQCEGANMALVRAADPAMWGRSGSALPPASQFAMEGVALRKADNDRFGGKQRVHQYLAMGEACAHHRAMGWTLCPMLHVLDHAAPQLCSTMENLPRDPKKPEDVDTKAKDHHYDALRYLLMQVGVTTSMIFDDVEPGGTLVLRGQFAFEASDLRAPVHSIPDTVPDDLSGAFSIWSQTD